MAVTNPTPGLFQLAKNALMDAYQSTKHFVATKLEKYQPKLARVTNITTAVTSATSTFQVTFGFLPIITSILTIVAAAPLFNFLVPNFLYSPYFYYPAIIGLSAFAGYMKYQELIERAKLDHKITENEKTTEGLSKTVTRLEKALAKTEQSVENLSRKCQRQAKTLCLFKHDHEAKHKKSRSALHTMPPRRSERLRATH